MRILVITNLYPPHHYGGYEITCRDAVEAWRSAGHDVLVLTSRIRLEGVPDDPPEKEAHILRRLGAYMHEHLPTFPPLRERIAIERTNLAALDDALARQTPDVVSVWHPAALSFGLLSTVRARGLPMALVVGDEWLIYGPEADRWLKPFKGHPWLGRIATKLTGLPAALPDLSRDVSASFVSEWLRRRTASASPFRVEPSAIHHPGVNLGVFEPDDAPPGPWTGRLLFAGRLDGRKGIHFIIRAIEKIEGATLDIIGRGNETYAQTLRDLAAELGVTQRVRFDRTSRSELARIYRDADVLVYPATWEEPFGLVPLEAMACGTPVISTGTGGAAEYLVDGSNCLLVAKRDPDAIVAQVKRLESDDALRSRLVAEGRRTAKEMTMARYATNLLRWHEAAAARFTDGVPEPL